MYNCIASSFHLFHPLTFHNHPCQLTFLHCFLFIRVHSFPSHSNRSSISDFIASFFHSSLFTAFHNHSYLLTLSIFYSPSLVLLPPQAVVMCCAVMCWWTPFTTWKSLPPHESCMRRRRPRPLRCKPMTARVRSDIWKGGENVCLKGKENDIKRERENGYKREERWLNRRKIKMSKRKRIRKGIKEDLKENVCKRE